MNEVRYRYREQLINGVTNSTCLIDRMYNQADELTNKNPNKSLLNLLTTYNKDVPRKRLFIVNQGFIETAHSFKRVRYQWKMILFKLVWHQLMLISTRLLTLLHPIHQQHSNRLRIESCAETKYIRIKIHDEFFLVVPNYASSTVNTQSVIHFPNQD